MDFSPLPPIQAEWPARDHERIRNHRAIAVLTSGYANAFLAKTAMSLLRYRPDEIVCVIDDQTDCRTAGELLGFGGEIPVCPDLATAPKADSVYLGIAPPGGKLPSEWRPFLLDALRRRMDVVSGLHDFLGDDPELVAEAARSGSQLIDVRRTDFKETATARTFPPTCKRILTVGQDCSVGKMVAALEVTRGLKERGQDAVFAATGQTGIMIAGTGVPIDRVIADFVNGAAEQLVAGLESHDWVLVEGQGSLSHPAYSAVTLGLLHGVAPDALIYCYEAGRNVVKGFNDFPLPTMRQQWDVYLANANLRHPCQMIGIAVNTRYLDADSARRELDRVEEAFGVPACDVYREGPAKLVDACLAYHDSEGVQA